MVSPNDEPQQTAAADVLVEQDTNEIKTISEEDFVKAQKIFQQGKKNLLLNKYAESVNNIEEAVKVYSAKFGEFDPQCAEIYFYFGKALLELARVENNVLGNALAGVPEDTGPIDDSRYGNPDEIAPEEKEQISDKVIDAMCEPAAGDEATEKKDTPATENGTTPMTEETKPAPMATTEETEKTNATSSEETATTKTDTVMTEMPAEEKKTQDEKEPSAEKKEETTETKEGGEEAEEDGGEEDGEDAEEEGEETGGDEEGKESAEEISNLQRAWEMFELAKLVYTKHYPAEGENVATKKRRVAECLLKLGEISIEQELYEQACSDIRECIRLQEEETERDERMLAESYYQLALSQQFANLFEDAKESFQRALNILQLRIEKLRGQLEAGGTACDEDEKTKINDEVAEIEALLPELNAKLEEVNEQDKQSMAAIQEAKECFLNTIGSGSTTNNGFGNGTATAGGEVKDITSMVKSKRKISGGPEDVNGLKKTRLSANGASTTDATSEENNEKMQTEEKAEEKTEERMEERTTEEKTEEKTEQETNGITTETTTPATTTTTTMATTEEMTTATEKKEEMPETTEVPTASETTTEEKTNGQTETPAAEAETKTATETETVTAVEAQ